ncbi:riboflavin synthase [Sphingomonas quercus]|uniref:Riboflavin synthase n=1 Tax=Sphingomonas quercus TaxID=2842451 RepID=A0ABS6BFD5_9SPHN|nr:riboflavin synthase [Sphingomonas quercus]MBU3077012.1 riboflavin synthase [Sphingomonas quercus]
MFTGIITDIGTVARVEPRGDRRITIACGYDLGDVELGASIACSGVCLTVVDKSAAGAPGWFSVDVSAETVSRTADQWQEGRRLNLERALKVGDELGGHIVTGHVDGVAEVIAIADVGDSRRIDVAVPAALGPYVAAKGSIAVDGVSLTVNRVEDVAAGTLFSVNIIPHTAGMTTLGALAPGDRVNIEIDVLARYLRRMEEYRK